VSGLSSKGRGLVTVVILAGCAATFAVLIGLILVTDRPVDDEHTLDASRRRHPSARQPTHVRGVERTSRPYDWSKDGDK
jgi:hypothetical protein